MDSNKRMKLPRSQRMLQMKDGAKSPRNIGSGAPTNGVQSVEQSMPEQKKKRRKKEKRG